ncbi:MAG: PPC domain-containing protein, partial [Opitutales bacterium]
MKITSQLLKERAFASIFALALFLTETLHAATPTLLNVMPRGGQKGSQLDVTITGSYLSDTEEIFFHTKGIEVEKISPLNDRSIKATLNIAANAKLGQHEMRVRTASGVSTMKTFWVGPFPNVAEEEPNSEFGKAQKIGINSTVNGMITNEDVDFYQIEAKKGHQISVEVEAIRLSGALFDPYVAILDAGRFELAACDDSALLLQDSVASVIAPEDGTYRIEIRDSSYRGAKNYYYRLHVGNFPRPLIAFPAGGTKGEKLETTLLGDPRGPIKQTLQLPEQADPDFGYVSERNGTSAPSPNRIRVSDFPSIREIEPNDNWKQATATELNLPLAFDGIIAEDGDIDYFKFKAKKGQRFNVRAHARSVSSPLDPVLNIRDASGKSLKGNDDANNGPDSLITSFTFPADGEYIFSIYDHLRKGGPQHIYRIETEAFEAEVVASIPYLRQRDSQSRQMMPVPRGNRVATIMNVTRRNFSGDLEFLAKGLPAGIRMHAPKATSNLTQVPIVFEAEENAPLASSLVDLRVRHVDPESKIEGGFRQQIDLVYGPPNNRTYFGSTLDRLAVAATEKAPYSIELIKPVTPIMQTGSMSLKVKVIRDANYTEAINVRLLTRPPGIGASSSVTIPAGKTEANYPITANGGAAVGTWQIAMLAAAKTKHGEIIVSSQLVDLEIEPPYLGLKINMSAIERGKEGEIICDVEQKRPFAGEAVVTLHGLPAKVSSTAQKIDANSTQLVFPINTDPSARAGLSRNLFCFVKIPLGENILNHSLASGGQLRMDNPPPAPKKPVAKKPKPTVVAAKPKPKTAKPLSRL